MIIINLLIFYHFTVIPFYILIKLSLSNEASLFANFISVITTFYEIIIFGNGLLVDFLAMKYYPYYDIEIKPFTCL